jgi:hypothetical protein
MEVFDLKVRIRFFTGLHPRILNSDPGRPDDSRSTGIGTLQKITYIRLLLIMRFGIKIGRFSGSSFLREEDGCGG